MINSVKTYFRSVWDELKKWLDDFYINNFEDENTL